MVRVTLPSRRVDTLPSRLSYPDSCSTREVQDKILLPGRFSLAEYAMKPTGAVSFVRLSVNSLSRFTYTFFGECFSEATDITVYRFFWSIMSLCENPRATPPRTLRDLLSRFLFFFFFFFYILLHNSTTIINTLFLYYFDTITILYFRTS